MQCSVYANCMLIFEPFSIKASFHKIKVSAFKKWISFQSVFQSVKKKDTHIESTGVKIQQELQKKKNLSLHPAI